MRAELGDLTITTDGETLTIDATEPGCGERWKVAYIGRLVEAAQAGHLAQLITLGRRWCAAGEQPAAKPPDYTITAGPIAFLRLPARNKRPELR